MVPVFPALLLYEILLLVGVCKQEVINNEAFHGYLVIPIVGMWGMYKFGKALSCLHPRNRGGNWKPESEIILEYIVSLSFRNF